MKDHMPRHIVVEQPRFSCDVLPIVIAVLVAAIVGLGAKLMVERDTVQQAQARAEAIAQAAYECAMPEHIFVIQAKDMRDLSATLRSLELASMAERSSFYAEMRGAK